MDLAETKIEPFFRFDGNENRVFGGSGARPVADDNSAPAGSSLLFLCVRHGRGENPTENQKENDNVTVLLR